MIHHWVVTTFFMLTNTESWHVFCLSGGCRFKVAGRKISTFLFRILARISLWKYLQLRSFLLRYIRNSSIKLIVPFEKILFGCFFPFLFLFSFIYNKKWNVAWRNAKENDVVPFTVHGNALYPANIPSIEMQDERITYPTEILIYHWMRNIAFARYLFVKIGDL